MSRTHKNTTTTTTTTNITNNNSNNNSQRKRGHGFERQYGTWDSLEGGREKQKVI